MRGVSEFLGRRSSGFSWSESAGAGTSSEWAGNDQPCRVRPAKALVAKGLGIGFSRVREASSQAVFFGFLGVGLG